MKVSVRIKTDKRQVLLSAEKGETLLSLLRRAGIPVTASCGGNGTCGKCRVLLDGREVPACRTAVSGDCEVVLTEAAGGAILGSASVPQEKGHEKTEGECFAAVDLGTTTVALELFSTDGRLLGSACDWNAQAAYGGDVISRISASIDGKLDLMTGVIQDALREMKAKLCATANVPQDQRDEMWTACNERQPQ